MKTAISLPEAVFEEAERFARHAPNNITEAMNGVCNYRCAQDARSRIMVALSRGDIWWAGLPEPSGSEPGFRRPVVVVQGDSLNRSRIDTVICVPLSSNMQWADAPGNVSLSCELTGLSKDSVANVSQVVTVDKRILTERVGKLPANKTELILSGIDIFLGRNDSG